MHRTAVFQAAGKVGLISMAPAAKVYDAGVGPRGPLCLKQTRRFKICVDVVNLKGFLWLSAPHVALSPLLRAAALGQSGSDRE